MGKSIISNLYNGNLCPASIPIEKTKKFKEHIERCEKLQLEIYNLLPENSKDMISKYTDYIENKNSYINEFTFKNGFSHGMQITIETLGL